MVFWLINGEDSYEEAWEFIAEAETTLPTLLDTTGVMSGQYSREEGGSSYAPYPVQVILDREGVIRYLSYQYDADLVTDTISALLAE